MRYNKQLKSHKAIYLVTPDLAGMRGSAIASPAMRCYSPSSRFFPFPFPNLDDQRTPDPAHRGYRPVHGEHGFDGYRDFASGDRRRYRHQPADAEARHHLVSAVAGGIHSGERL